MQPTDFKTISVRPLGPAVSGATPTVIVKAERTPLRVLVHNVGPVTIFVSDTVTDLVPLTLAAYRVFPGDEPSFVVEVKQSLYCIGAAVGGLLSYSASEALPFDGYEDRS